MTWVIVGLGNPGEQYDETRHNTGRMAVERFAKEKKIEEWKEDKKANALVARALVEKAVTVLVLPETFMNKSGSAVMKFVKSVKAAEKLLVVYDDLDLPLGKIKLSFDRGDGGHRGVASIARGVKTKKFWRIRVGVSPTSGKGDIKKPQGEKAVNDFILGKFKPDEEARLKKVMKRAVEAIDHVLTEGPMKAMGEVNSV